MKFYKSVLVRKEDEKNAADLYGCFGWAVAGEEKNGLHSDENSVWLKLVRDSETERYAELVSVETRYCRAEAESRYWEEIRAEAELEKTNRVVTVLLFCCFIVPGILYLAVNRCQKGKRLRCAIKAERRIASLAEEKRDLIEEAKLLAQAEEALQ